MIYLNGDPVNTTLFPDNTSQVWKLDEKHFNQEWASIVWDYSHEGETMQLAQLKMLLDQSVDFVQLHIKYLPYGRQDKEVSNSATFALRTFAQVLNSMGFSDVYILDPHSSAALALIGHSKAVYPSEQLKRVYDASASTVVCYPDTGAYSKYINIYKFDNVIHGNKVRDQLTGHILSYELIGSCKGERVMIVDDICDGGKTFELLAKDLYEAGAQVVNLFVTHGIFSKGLRPLHHANITHIYTAKGEAVNGLDGIIYKALP